MFIFFQPLVLNILPISSQYSYLTFSVEVLHTGELIVTTNSITNFNTIITLSD